jgi:hypothetical protein
MITRRVNLDNTTREVQPRSDIEIKENSLNLNKRKTFRRETINLKNLKTMIIDKIGGIKNIKAQKNSIKTQDTPKTQNIPI